MEEKNEISAQEIINIHGKDFTHEEVVEVGRRPIRRKTNIFRWVGLGLLIFGLFFEIIAIFATIVTKETEYVTSIASGLLLLIPGAILFGLSFKKRDPFLYGKNILERKFPAPLDFNGKIVDVLNGDKIIALTKRPLSQLIVDSSSLQFQVLTKGRYSKIFSDVDVIDYEIRVDNEVVMNSQTKSKKGVGKALVGGALFGEAGLVAGAVAGNSKQSTTVVQKEIHHYSLILKVNDISNPSFVLAMESVDVAEEVAAVLLILLKNRKKDSNPPINIKSEPSGERIDKFAEIKKYKDLLDAGIITQEEFDQKKKEIL